MRPRLDLPGKLTLARRTGPLYVSCRSNGVPGRGFRGPAERHEANLLNLIRFVPAEGLDA